MTDRNLTILTDADPLPRPPSLGTGRPRRAARGRLPWGFTLVCLVVAVFSMVLKTGFPVMAIGGASADDALFVKLAYSLRAGQWLGPFDNLTLVKGMFYPAFIAASSAVGLPLKLAEQAVYLLAAVLAALLVRRCGRETSIAPAAIFTVLALDPNMWTQAFTRVIREGLYIGLTLGVVILLVWISFRPMRPLRAVILGIATGSASAAFLLTREEGLWLAPTVAVILALACLDAVGLHRRNWRALWRPILPWGAAAATSIAAVLAVAAVNHAHYGVYETTEVQSLPFRRAYAALAGIEQDRWRPYVVFPKDARERSYAVSAAARELAPMLDGPAAETWRDVGCAETGQPDCTEILAGWFQWALRDAVAAAGHYTTGADAAAYYDRLADEIEGACGRGELRCLPPRATLSPPFRKSYIGDTLRTLPVMTDVLFGLGAAGIAMPASQGTPDQVAWYAGMVGPTEPPMPETVSGWVVADGPLPQLGLELASGSPADTPIALAAAPDLAEAHPGLRSERFSFGTQSLFLDSRMTMTGQAGAERTVPLAELVTGVEFRLGRDKLHVDEGFDHAVALHHRAVIAVASGIASVYVELLPFGVAAAALGLVAAWFCRRRTAVSPVMAALALSSATAVVTRLVLISYLDATAIPSVNDLYMSPAAPLLLLFACVGIDLGIRAARGFWQARRRQG